MIRRLGAAPVAGQIGGPPLVKYKTADETVTSSAALQNDDHFSLPIGANEAWFVICKIRATNAAAVGDIKFALTVPAGCTGWHAVSGLDPTVDSSVGNAKNQSIGNLASPLAASVPNTSNSDPFITYSFYVENGATPGTVQVQWAQNTSDGSGTVSKKGSTMLATRLL